MSAPGRVAVVGSINTDLLARVARLPRPGETRSGAGFSVVGGGKGANAALAATRLGAPVTLVAALGTDDFGAARLADLAAEGLDLTLVERIPGVPSGVALILVEESGENCIVVIPGANGHLAPEQVTALTLGPRDVLLTQLEVPLLTVEAALRRARDRGATALLNFAPFQPAATGLLALTDLLVVNELEAADLLDARAIALPDAPDAVTALLARGPDAVALTLGPHGAVVGRAGAIRHLPAPAVATVDTTAAGDAFTGALAARLIAGDDLFAAAATAVAAGSLTVTRAGAWPALPYRREVAALMGQVPHPGGA